LVVDWLNRSGQMNAVFVQLLVALFWCLAAACNLSLIYGLYGTVNGYVHLSTAVRSFYAAVHRTVWAVGVAWVIFACVTGNGGEFVLVGIDNFSKLYVVNALLLRSYFHLSDNRQSMSPPISDVIHRLEFYLLLLSLSASLYFSKRGAYWDRLWCRWSLVGCHARELWPNGAS